MGELDHAQWMTSNFRPYAECLQAMDTASICQIFHTYVHTTHILYAHTGTCLKNATKQRLLYI